MICALCGVEFTRRPRSTHKQRFCSDACRFKWNKQVNPVGVKRHRAACLNYWHKADGGYIRRRRRELASERQEILRLLEEVHG